MTYKTHFVGGICAGAVVSSVINVESIAVPAFIIASAVASLVPDVDIKGSKMNNKMGIVGKAVSATSNHRGFYHTPILYIVLYFLMGIVLPESIAFGFLVGAMSHLVLDTFNSKGIMWFWPITRKHFHIASIRTRTAGESAFMVVMVVVTVLFVISQNMGFMNSFPVLSNFEFMNFSDVNLPELPKIDFHMQNNILSDFNFENVKGFVENMIFSW